MTKSIVFRISQQPLHPQFLCQDYQIQGELRHAGYIQNWLTCLKENNQAIFKAAALAQKAADYLNGLDALTNQAAA